MKDRMYVFPASSHITPSLRFPVPDYRMICYMGEDDRMQKILAGCFDRHLFECIPSFLHCIAVLSLNFCLNGSCRNGLAGVFFLSFSFVRFLFCLTVFSLLFLPTTIGTYDIYKIDYITNSFDINYFSYVDCPNLLSDKNFIFFFPYR